MSDLGIELDGLSATPLWEQLADQLRARILDGRIAPDRKLPTEASLSEELEVGRSTAARVMAKLREEGLVVFVPGKGTFTARADVIVKARRKAK